MGIHHVSLSVGVAPGGSSRLQDASERPDSRMDSSPDRTDEQLVDSFQRSGDAGAAEELLRRHLPRVRGVVLPMVLDDSTADDLTQEAFLRAFRGLKGFRRKATFATWLYRLTVNVVYDHFKSKGNTAVEYHPRVPDQETSLPTPDAAALHIELDTEIESALAELPPKLRGAIVLTCFEQVGVKEAARIEGCTTGTMYWRIHEARKRLRNRLAKYLKP
jgi:RNA polymerase sigma-70 factor (ECF subfamily)